MSRFFGKTAGGLAQVAGMAVMYGIHAYGARGLGASEYGNFNILLAYVMISSTIAMFGVSYYLPVYGTNGIDKQLITVYLLISLIISIFNSLVFFLLGLIEINDLVYFTLGTVGISWLEISRTIEVIKQRFFYASMVRYMLPGLFSVIYFILRPLDIVNFYAVIFIMPFIASLPILKCFSVPSLTTNPFNKSVWFYFAMQILYLSYIHIVKVAQDWISTVEVVAFFSLAYMIVRLILLVPSYMSLAYLPELRICYKSAQKRKMLDIYNHIIVVSSLFTINIVLLCWFYTDDIVLFYGKSYEGLAEVLRYLLVLPILIAFIGPNGPILIAAERIKSELVNGIILIFIAVCVTLSFGGKSNAFIALAVVFAESFVAVRKRYLSLDILDYRLFNISAILKLTFCGILLYTIFYLVELLGIGLVLDLIIKLLASILYLLLGFIFLKGKYEIIKL